MSRCAKGRRTQLMIFFHFSIIFQYLALIISVPPPPDKIVSSGQILAFRISKQTFRLEDFHDDI